ncbi:MAG: GntR family transcriptional regulator [Bryobacteraceae bacterium]
MPKIASSLELMLAPPAPGQTLGAWLYGELREALLAGRLKAGTRLPSSRELSQQHGLARGTVVAVLERLHAEGYLDSRVGAGTWVSAVMSSDRASEPFARTPRFIRQIAAAYERPKAFAGLTASHPPRPFRMRDADVTEFPGELWATLANRRSRNFRSWLEGEDDPRGYRPLREAISRYLGSSRGVRC